MLFLLRMLLSDNGHSAIRASRRALQDAHVKDKRERGGVEAGTTRVRSRPPCLRSDVLWEAAAAYSAP